MSVLADWQILELCKEEGMIHPYESSSIKTRKTEKGEQRILSYGLSSYGYDMTLSEHELKVFTNMNGALIDPRKIDPEVYVTPKLMTDEDGLCYYVLPPNSGSLGHTVEFFKIPRDILGICLGKSTYVRAMISILVTPLEPEWQGHLVVEIVNHSTSPVKIYPNQGIGQIVFHEASAVCQVSYADRDGGVGGKYQNQVGTQDAKV